MWAWRITRKHASTIQVQNQKDTVPFFTLGSGSRAPSQSDAMLISYTWKKREDRKPSKSVPILLVLHLDIVLIATFVFVPYLFRTFDSPPWVVRYLFLEVRFHHAGLPQRDIVPAIVQQLSLTFHRARLFISKYTSRDIYAHINC